MKTHAMLLCMLAGCGDRHMDDDESGPPVTSRTDVADGSAHCSATCDGKCVDLETDDEHCGACDHGCKSPDVFGPCEQGSCPAAFWCGSPRLEHSTCEDVCAFYGQRCVEGPPQDRRVCGGTQLFFEYAGDALEICEAGGESHRFSSTCTETIDWTIFSDTGPYSEAVACCCTQEPA